MRCRLENEVLTLGAPAAAVPVESLYKPWADGRERRRGVSAEFGAARHLLLGDSAQHMRALYRALELEVPMGFCAMPDHVTLMTEVVALCVDAGNHEAALALLSEHFDWLDAYEQTLLAHAAALSSAPPSARTDELARALAHGRELAVALAAAVRDLSVSLR